MRVANTHWLLDVESSGAERLEFNADVARSWLGHTGGDKLDATCVELKTLLRSCRDVYETFGQQLPQDLISAATATRIRAEGLVHCVKVVKNLEKNERSDNNTNRYAKAPVERFGSAELVEIHALIPEAIFMPLRKLSCFHEESRLTFSVVMFFLLGALPEPLSVCISCSQAERAEFTALVVDVGRPKDRARRWPMMLQVLGTFHTEVSQHAKSARPTVSKTIKF